MLAEILKLSQFMVQLARQQQWDDLDSHDKHRMTLLKKMFSRPVPPSQGRQVAVVINKVLELNKELLELCQTEKGHSSDALHKMSVGKRAQKAYKS